MVWNLQLKMIYDMIWLWVRVDLVPLTPPPKKKENKQNKNKKEKPMSKVKGPPDQQPGRQPKNQPGFQCP